MTDSVKSCTTLSESAMKSMITGLSEENKIKLYELLDNTLERYHIITYSFASKETHPVEIQLSTFYWNEVLSYLAKYEITADDDPRGSLAYDSFIRYWIDPVADIAFYEDCTEEEVLNDSYFTQQIAEIPDIKLCGYAKNIPDRAHRKYCWGTASLIIIRTGLQGIKKITDSLWEGAGYYDL